MAFTESGSATGELQDVEVVAGEEGVSTVSEDYQVVTDQEAGIVQIMDRRTGDIVAVVPFADAGDATIESITMMEGGGVSMVTLAPAEGHTVTEDSSIAQVITLDSLPVKQELTADQDGDED